MNKAVIVSAVRTPLGRANRGSLKDIRPDELAAIAVKGSLDRIPNLDKNDVDDVIMGCAFPELEQGFNAARTIALRAGLPNTSSAMTINRFCSSGLQAVALGFQQVMAGWSDVVIAGGFESMSTIPLGGMKLCPNPYLMENYPEYYLAMGLTAEEVAKRYNVTREMQDKFAYNSFIKAEDAVKTGRFKDEIISVEIEINGAKRIVETDDLKDGITPDRLASSRPAFKFNGTVTGNNSSQMTDGASALVIMSERKAKELGLKPLATLKSFAVAGCDPDIMGIGPIYAIPKALKYADMELSDIQIIELNEAFAAQAIACIDELGINKEIVNKNGGAIALGHPLGATGARLTTSLIYEMEKRDLKYGLVSMCIGGGMGAAGIFERL
ncbi:acetyl-CoA acyltransferase [Proteiniborus ethanoligenes]|uniref:Acetyl-CoA acetyltransferase n=1 Tax=Proteiniborus ethanoligenes TaxID=415015 RepID=A0A1H3SGD5_9FIRM|nr:thiolase family protein [Proteiniborus ethanoligenes]SDZ36159.1 acetyl-CoA acyltransferase [Proteiniborus ethanoligenes]